MRDIRDVVAQDLCSGCGLCAGLDARVEMRLDDRGFQRPVVTDDDAASVIAMDVCPGVGSQVSRRSGKGHRLWGHVEKGITAWASDDETRFAGSSGGALTAICAHLLRTREVDAVLHCRADPDLPDRTRATVSATGQMVFQNAGSRYGPSPTLAGLDAVLSSGKTYAVVGKPCEIAALAQLRLSRADVAEAFPVLLSFFCAGIPSQTATVEMLRAMGAEPAEVTEFRYRGEGWPGRATARLRNGKEVSLSYAESWGDHLSPHIQTRCKLCADGVGMAADIVCADGWEVDDAGYPVFEERPGESVVLARTPFGQALLEQALEADALRARPLDLSALDLMQPGQVRRRRAVAMRLLGRRLALRPVPKFAGFGIWRAARGHSIKALLREFAGSFLRAVKFG